MPVYRRPSNLFVRGTNQNSAGLPNKGQVFRKIGRRKLVPYYDRAEIEDGAIEGRGLEICWLRNQTDLLFTQIQGSARVNLDDGTTLRINYDAHNGYPYTAVGRILIDRGIIPKEQMSMQKIREWMDQNPNDADELRRQNRSYIFFREVQLSDKDEAVGAQGVPLTPGRSIAVDKSLHVYGTPFFIEGQLPIESEVSKTPFRRLMIAQDTGSAIVGPARADLYFGAGSDAGKIAGRLKNSMRFVMLVPKSLDPSARGRLVPVPDARPSEKIAKLFPQTDPLKDAKPAVVAPAVTPPAAGSTQKPAAPTAQDHFNDLRALQPLKPLQRLRPRDQRQNRCRCRKRGLLPRLLPKNPAVAPDDIAADADETPDDDPRIAAAAAAQARPQRRGARAVGKRRQAGQAAAQAAPRGEAAGRFAGSRSQGRAETGCLGKTQPAPAPIIAPPRPAPPPLAPIGRRERSHLSRGRKEIDARLDLHGMTQTRAHRALFGFLQRAHHDGLTFVLVITGKGKMGAGSERGVLRRQVPEWLSLPEFRIVGGRLRGSRYRPWRRGRVVCAGAALADFNDQNGRTIPTLGISVTIQPNAIVLRSSVEISGTSCDAGNIFTACRIRNRHTAQFEIQRE